MIKRPLFLFIGLFLYIQIFVHTAAFGASISTLTDNFNDNSIDGAKWTNGGGAQVVETNQELEITSTITGGYWYLISVSAYDFTGSGATLKIIDAGNQTLVSPDFYFSISDAIDGIEVAYWKIKNGTIAALKYDNESETSLASTAYVAATHKYLRTREAGGTTYFDYSADGLNWTNFTSTANFLPDITQVTVSLELAGDVELSTTTVKLDDFNILPSAARRMILIE